MQEIFLARQPIVDSKEKLFGFELLFRSCDSNEAGMVDGTHATAQVVVNAFGEMGLGKVLGTQKGFINLDAHLLHGDLIELLPKERIVLELLETVVIDEAVIRRCAELKCRGYSLSLDDVSCLDRNLEPLLGMVDIVKLDLTQIDYSHLPALVSALRRYPVKLLAEKVESREQARHCVELGFDMFQGYYFARPEMLSGKRIPPSKMVLLHILTLMMGSADDKEIELIFKAHPNLAYSLLRMVNSAASCLTNKISSIRHGLVAFGQQPLLRWVQLLLYASGTNGGGMSPLMQLAAMRGKLMELIARQETDNDHDYVERSFMVGILSLLEALFGIPMPEVLMHMNLNEEVEMALLERDGRIGEWLTLCESLEHGDMASLHEYLRHHPRLTLGNLNQAQVEALAWANAIAA